MGRLFWKFFMAILLAQVIATLGIGGALWLKNRNTMLKQPDIDTSPPAYMAIESAAATLEYGGTEALRGLLGSLHRLRVYAVDETGRDLLGRVVKPGMLVEARFIMAQADRRNSVRDVHAKDGHRYLLFLPSAENLNGITYGRSSSRSDGFDLGAPLFSVLAEIERSGQRRYGPRRAGPPQDRLIGDTTPGDAAASVAPGAAPPDGSAAGGPPNDVRGPPPDPARDRFYELRPFIPLAIAALASLMCAFLLAWYFARPIRDLRQAFEAASNGDLAPRFSAAGHKRGDELNDLGRDFDRMAGRLRSLMDGQTRLLHDVSHELRSPLARLQAAIGLAHQQPDKVPASLERIERESVRMDKLVGELLTLSRLEAGALHAMGEQINLTHLIEEIVDDARFEAQAQQRSIMLAGDVGNALLVGQPDLLARAIENVVRNAIKHSPTGGAVELELGLHQHGRRLQMVVRDRGPGVAEADLTSIFEPFFRGASTQKDTEGHGLGLAIARHVVDAHGGAIAAFNRPGGGLTVEITLPLLGLADLPGEQL